MQLRAEAARRARNYSAEAINRMARDAEEARKMYNHLQTEFVTRTRLNPQDKELLHKKMTDAGNKWNHLRGELEEIRHNIGVAPPRNRSLSPPRARPVAKHAEAPPPPAAAAPPPAAAAAGPFDYSPIFRPVGGDPPRARLSVLPEAAPVEKGYESEPSSAAGPSALSRLTSGTWDLLKRGSMAAGGLAKGALASSGSLASGALSGSAKYGAVAVEEAKRQYAAWKEERDRDMLRRAHERREDYDRRMHEEAARREENIRRLAQEERERAAAAEARAQREDAERRAAEEEARRAPPAIEEGGSPGSSVLGEDAEEPAHGDRGAGGGGGGGAGSLRPMPAVYESRPATALSSGSDEEAAEHAPPPARVEERAASPVAPARVEEEAPRVEIADMGAMPMPPMRAVSIEPAPVRPGSRMADLDALVRAADIEMADRPASPPHVRLRSPPGPPYDPLGAIGEDSALDWLYRPPSAMPASAMHSRAPTPARAVPSLVLPPMPDTGTPSPMPSPAPTPRSHATTPRIKPAAITKLPVIVSSTPRTRTPAPPEAAVAPPPAPPKKRGRPPGSGKRAFAVAPSDESAAAKPRGGYGQRSHVLATPDPLMRAEEHIRELEGQLEEQKQKRAKTTVKQERPPSPVYRHSMQQHSMPDRRVSMALPPSPPPPPHNVVAYAEPRAPRPVPYARNALAVDPDAKPDTVRPRVVTTTTSYL